MPSTASVNTRTPGPAGMPGIPNAHTLVATAARRRAGEALGAASERVLGGADLRPSRGSRTRRTASRTTRPATSRPATFNMGNPNAPNIIVLPHGMTRDPYQGGPFDMFHQTPSSRKGPSTRRRYRGGGDMRTKAYDYYGRSIRDKHNRPRKLRRPYDKRYKDLYSSRYSRKYRLSTRSMKKKRPRKSKKPHKSHTPRGSNSLAREIAKMRKEIADLRRARR